MSGRTRRARTGPARRRVPRTASSCLAATLAPLAGFLFPDSCLSCGEALRRGEAHLCERCRRLVEPAIRAITLPDRRCRGAPGPCRTPAFFLLPFEGPARALVHALKYGRRVSAARALIELCAPVLKGLPIEGIDVTVPVPLHRVRHRERGFNQAALLAKELERSVGIPASPGLRRTRPTLDQTRLPRGGRLANVRDAFAGLSDVVEGARVLLLDDVVTTGATLGEAAFELGHAGARSVICVAVAGRTPAASPARPGPRAARRARAARPETG